MSSPGPSLNEIADASTFRILSTFGAEKLERFRSNPNKLQTLVLLMRRIAVELAERYTGDLAIPPLTFAEIVLVAAEARTAAESEAAAAAAAAISTRLDTVIGATAAGSSTSATDPPVHRSINTSDAATGATVIGTPTDSDLTAIIRMLADASLSNPQ